MDTENETIEWAEMESSRDVRSFRYGDNMMMIIPSLQDDLFHVIVGKPSYTPVNILLTKEGIWNQYGIEL